MTDKHVAMKTPNFRWALAKTILYITALAIALALINFYFHWTSSEDMPAYLRLYSGFFLAIYPYRQYIEAIVLFAFGYLIVHSASQAIYAYTLQISQHATAATIRSIVRIAGIAVLLAFVASVFNVNPAAALTVGSFGGLVVGFATQNVLSNTLAGIFLLFSRPFTYGDFITVASQTGTVKEIKLMYTTLETEDGKNEILIPSSTIVTQIIKKKLPSPILKSESITLILDPPPKAVKERTVLVFTGRLIQTQTGAPIPNKAVRIFDKDIGKDEPLAVGTTNINGSFAIPWRVKKIDPLDRTAKVYAIFIGSKEYKSVTSQQHTITISK